MQGPEEYLENYFHNEIELSRKKLMKKWAKLDNTIFKTRSKNWVVKDFGSRTIWTPYGNIKFKRRRYQHKKTGKYSYLLDKKLQMPKGKFILDKYRELALFYYRVFKSYKEIANNVFHGQVSKMSIHRFINEQSSEWVMQNYKCNNDGILWINADGFWLKKHKSKKSVELKNFLFFTGRSKNRLCKWELEGKVIKSFLDESKAEMIDILERIIDQFEDVREIRLIGDGARWIKNVAKKLGAIYYIDKFHMRKSLKDLLPREFYYKGLNILSMEQSRYSLRLRLMKLAANEETGKLNKKQLQLIGYIVNNHKYYIRSVADKTINAIEAIQAHSQGRYLKNQRKGFSLKTLKIIINNLMSFTNGAWQFTNKSKPNEIFIEGNGKSGKNVPIFNYGISSSSTYKMLQGILDS